MPVISVYMRMTYVGNTLKLAGNAENTVLNAWDDLGNTGLDTSKRANVGNSLAALA